MFEPKTQKDSRPSVLLVTSNDEFADAAMELLHQTVSLSLIAPTDVYLEALSEATVPDLYIVDIDDTDWLLNGAMANVQKIRQLSPDTPIIVATYDLSTNTLLPAMRAGANDVLDKNMGADEILALVDHHAMRRPVRRGDQTGQVIAFWSPRAGVGATSAAVALSQAICLNPEFKGRLLYLDFSIPPSEGADILGMTPTYSVLDALSDLHRFDDTLIESAIANDDKKFYLLPFATHEGGFDADLIGQVPNMIAVLRSFFDYVLVDCNRMVAPHEFDRIFCDADVPVLCTDQSLPTIHACIAGLAHIRERVRVGLDFRLLVTRHDPNIVPGVAEIADAFSYTGIPAIVPWDREYVDGRRNAGKPLVSPNGRTRFQQSICRFLATIDGELAGPLQASRTSGVGMWRKLLHLPA